MEVTVSAIKWVAGEGVKSLESEADHSRRSMKT
jgi:hypothetical protein